MATITSARAWKCRIIIIMTSLIALLGSVSCTIPSSNEGSSLDEYIVTLDHSNFSDFISKHKFIVVMFYAPWCGHCKKLSPAYEKAAKILNKNDPPVILAKIDANEEKNKPLASEYEIKGFPTLKILRYGGSIVQDYKGPRDADGIVAYLKKQSGPASAEIKSADDAAALINGKKVVIVGVFPEFSGDKFENFTTLADRLRSDYEFGHTHNAEYLPHGNTSVTGPAIRLLKPFDELFVDFKVFDVDSLVTLVEESSIPTVTVFNKDPDNHPFVIKFFNSPNSKAMLFLNFSSNPVDAFKSKFHEVAMLYKGKGISFLVGDVEASQGAFQFFGLRDDQVPLIIIQTNDGGKYLKTNLEPDHIASWVKKFEDGSLQPYRKSEPIPVFNNESVKVVVADNLQDVVFNSQKNVLLEFYAPWCGHCMKLAPTLDKVAVSFEKDSDVIIAKIDATANDIPRETFDVKGYPTIYFVSASGKVLRFEDERTKGSFINFIQQNRDKHTERSSVKEEL